MNGYLLHEKLAELYSNVGQDARWAYRRLRLRKSIKEHLDKPYRLSDEQRKAAEDYWKQYTNHFSPLWHEFLFQKTGNFDVRFIPEDIMYTEIEGYFNDYNAAKGIDNKCNYDLLFPEVKQPETICRRMRGIWHDKDWNIISKDEDRQKCINSALNFKTTSR